MTGGILYLLDLPVYRVCEDKYLSEVDAYIERSNAPTRRIRAQVTDPKKLAQLDQLEERFRAHLVNAYGGIWRYNEIIAWLRLHIVGTQVRAELYGMDKKRICKTRRKQFEFKSWKLAPEAELPVRGSDEQIYAAILDHVQACRRELKGRYVDTSALEVLGTHVKWHEFF